MAKRIEFDLISDRTTRSSSSSSSSTSRRCYSQRHVSSLQHELTKNRKMINVKTAHTTILNRTLSFKPLPVTSPSLSLANVENTPVKLVTSKKISFNFDASNIASSSQETIEEDEFVEETPVKEDDETTELVPSEGMAREIQRLSLRLRSSTHLYNVPVLDKQPTKPATLHLSQVVNRVSRCNYVLRRFVREAQKYSPKQDEIHSAPPRPFSSLHSHEKGRRRLFVDSPQSKQIDPTVPGSQQKQHPVTPRKASGVIKQLFASPSSSLKRPLSSPSNTAINIHDKRQRLF